MAAPPTPSYSMHLQFGSYTKAVAKYSSTHNKNRAKLFATLQQLLDQHPQGAARSEEPSTIEKRALLNALTLVQKKPATAKESVLAIEEAALTKSLDNELNHPKIQVSSKDINNTIDIISLLFKTLLEDTGLPKTMTALLEQLHIPILKVAILDNTFFSQKKHPARQLINQLTQAALTWSAVTSSHQDTLYRHINAAIKRILNEFEQDLSLFNEINQEFSTFIAREQRVATALEKRMQQIAAGKEKLEIANSQVAHEINSRINEQALPPVLTKLLLKAWKDLLLLIYMRQGPQSKAWKKSLLLMDQLLWSVAPKQTPAEQQKLLRLMPTLYRQLKEGLLCISFDASRIEPLFKELRSCQIDSLHAAPQNRGAQHKQASSTVHPPIKPNNIEEIVILNPQITSFSIGTWFEISHDNGTLIRAKLAWRSVIDGSLTLTNRQGITVLEISANQLSYQLQNNTAQILKELDVPLVDRALLIMLDNLQAPKKKQA